MKKRLFACLAVGIIVSALTACCYAPEVQFNNQKTNEEISSKYNLDPYGNVMNYFSTLDILLEENANYEIYTDEAHSAFLYTVRDNQGNIIDHGYHSYRGSFGFEEHSDLLVMKYGNGGNSWSERYYDVTNGNISRLFECPVAHSDSMVAYFTFDAQNNNIILVIQNIFDASRYYCEISRNFSDHVIKECVEAEFIENDTQLKISYWVTPDNEYITEIISLET